MSAAHGAHGPAGTEPWWLLWAVPAAAAAALYMWAMLRQRRARGWSRWRGASFAVGAALVVAAVSPAVQQWAHHDPRGHMLQHLLIGMYAPVALVMAAPVTLALATMPVAAGRRAAGLLRSRPVHGLGRPVTVLVLDTGGLYLVHLSALHEWAHGHAGVHALVHLHYLAAGCLFAWFVAGPDPAPRRPGTAVRLGVLVVAAAAHAVLAKLLYAHLWLWPPGTDAAAARQAAQMMYYGGDLAEVLLAVAVLCAWYRRGGRARPTAGVAASPPYRYRPLVQKRFRPRL